jgi:hypothetical protein
MTVTTTLETDSELSSLTLGLYETVEVRNGEGSSLMILRNTILEGKSITNSYIGV